MIDYKQIDNIITSIITNEFLKEEYPVANEYPTRNYFGVEFDYYGTLFKDLDVGEFFIFYKKDGVYTGFRSFRKINDRFAIDEYYRDWITFERDGICYKKIYKK